MVGNSTLKLVAATYTLKLVALVFKFYLNNRKYRIGIENKQTLFMEI